MVDADWCLHWMCVQCQMGWLFRHRTGWSVHHRGSLEQVWQPQDAQGKSTSQSWVVENLTQADGTRLTRRLPRLRSHSHSLRCLHLLLLPTLLDPREQRSWRCSDEFAVPGQPARYRSRQEQSSRGRIRLPHHAEEHGLRRRSAPLSRPDLP